MIVVGTRGSEAFCWRAFHEWKVRQSSLTKYKLIGGHSGCVGKPETNQGTLKISRQFVQHPCAEFRGFRITNGKGDEVKKAGRIAGGST